MKKRLSLLALILSAIMPLSACSKNQSVATPTSEEKPTELKMNYVTFTTVPTDLQLVEDEINKITKAKINATVKIEPINVGAYGQQINLKLSSNEEMDLFVTGTLTGMFDYAGQSSKGQLFPLDDLIKKYGSGISEALGSDYLNASKVGGKIYGLPTLKDMAAEHGMYIKKEFADKYNIDVTKIKTLEDMEATMKTMKENQPNLYFGVAGTTIVDNFGVGGFGDTLGDSYGVLMNAEDASLKVVNYYETPEYAALLKTIRRWYTSGYVLPGIATNKESTTSLTKANKLYGYAAVINPLGESLDSRGIGAPMVAAPVFPAISATLNATNFMWAIPSYSEKSDKAMEFLNLMYTDKELVNLFDYGIEGKHYTKVSGSENVIDFPSGVNATNSGYNLNQAFMFGNEFLSNIWNGNDVDSWTKMAKFNEDAIKSVALGFLFDPSPVKTEYASVTNVVAQYKIPLENGAVDPDKILPEFILKLKTAGIDKVITEKQKQIDEWSKINSK